MGGGTWERGANRACVGCSKAELNWMNIKSIGGLMLVVGMISVLAGAPCAKAGDGDEKAVLTANVEFYKALNQMFAGELTLMKELCSHASDVIYMGPGGDFLVGWPKVQVEWERQAAMKMGGKLEAMEPHVILSTNGDMATVCNIEKGKNKDNKGEMREISIRATNTFRKEGGKWKMVGHHVDLLSNFKD